MVTNTYRSFWSPITNEYFNIYNMSLLNHNLNYHIYEFIGYDYSIPHQGIHWKFI